MSLPRLPIYIHDYLIIPFTHYSTSRSYNTLLRRFILILFLLYTSDSFILKLGRSRVYAEYLVGRHKRRGHKGVKGLAVDRLPSL